MTGLHLEQIGLVVPLIQSDDLGQVVRDAAPRLAIVGQQELPVRRNQPAEDR
jgi:hypothetical protein